MRGIIGPSSHGQPVRRPDVVVGVDVVHSSLHLFEEGGEVARAGQAVEVVAGSRPCARVIGR